MRVLIFAAAAFLVCMAGACSPSAPPHGRWQGAYESRDVMILARLEIDSKGNIFLVAPDVTDVATRSAEERALIRQRLTDGLNQAWGETVPRRFDFDGRVFRKPGGIAPQLEWDASAGVMTAVVYLGTRSAIRFPLRSVADFNGDPWRQGTPRSHGSDAPHGRWQQK